MKADDFRASQDRLVKLCAITILCLSTVVMYSLYPNEILILHNNFQREIRHMVNY